MLHAPDDRLPARHLRPARADRRGDLVSPHAAASSGLPFAGVDRQPLPPRSARRQREPRRARRRRCAQCLRADLAARVAENFADYHVLAAARRRATSRAWQAELGDEPLLLVPHLDDDVHDVDGPAAGAPLPVRLRSGAGEADRRRRGLMPRRPGPVAACSHARGDRRGRSELDGPPVQADSQTVSSAIARPLARRRRARQQRRRPIIHHLGELCGPAASRPEDPLLEPLDAARRPVHGAAGDRGSSTRSVTSVPGASRSASPAPCRSPRGASSRPS